MCLYITIYTYFCAALQIWQISDFGMARDLADDTYYTVQSKGGKIPVKWTAPEVGFMLLM